MIYLMVIYAVVFVLCVSKIIKELITAKNAEALLEEELRIRKMRNRKP